MLIIRAAHAEDLGKVRIPVGVFGRLLEHEVEVDDVVKMTMWTGAPETMLSPSVSTQPPPASVRRWG